MRDTMPLLVAVHADDEQRCDALTKLVAEAGHRVVDAEQSDVILSDEQRSSASRPTLVLADETLSGGNHSPENTLPRDASPRQIDAALRAIAAGLTIRIARAAPRRRFEELADSPANEILSPRELDVIDAIGAGLSNKAIARELGISLHTVKFHIESLLRKLGARTRAEAVAKAMERRRRQAVEL